MFFKSSMSYWHTSGINLFFCQKNEFYHYCVIRWPANLIVFDYRQEEEKLCLFHERNYSKSKIKQYLYTCIALQDFYISSDISLPNVLHLCHKIIWLFLVSLYQLHIFLKGTSTLWFSIGFLYNFCDYLAFSTYILQTQFCPSDKSRLLKWDLSTDASGSFFLNDEGIRPSKAHKKLQARLKIPDDVSASHLWPGTRALN